MSFRPLGVETFDPTIRVIDRTGTVTATASGRRRVTRKDFTDRLGLPEDATNAQFMAALDARLGRQQLSPASPEAAEDQLYARVTGRAQQGTTAAVSDSELGERIYGNTAGA